MNHGTIEKYLGFIRNINPNNINEQQFIDLGKIIRLTAEDEINLAKQTRDENRYNKAAQINEGLNGIGRDNITPDVVNGMIRIGAQLLEYKLNNMPNNNGGMFSNNSNSLFNSGGNNNHGFNSPASFGNTISFGNTSVNGSNNQPDITINNSSRNKQKKKNVTDMMTAPVAKPKVLMEEEILSKYPPKPGNEFKPLYGNNVELRLVLDNGEYEWTKGE